MNQFNGINNGNMSAIRAATAARVAAQAAAGFSTVAGGNGMATYPFPGHAGPSGLALGAGGQNGQRAIHSLLVQEQVLMAHAQVLRRAAQSIAATTTQAWTPGTSLAPRPDVTCQDQHSGFAGTVDATSPEIAVQEQEAGFAGMGVDMAHPMSAAHGQRGDARTRVEVIPDTPCPISAQEQGGPVIPHALELRTKAEVATMFDQIAFSSGGEVYLHTSRPGTYELRCVQDQCRFRLQAKRKSDLMAWKVTAFESDHSCDQNTCGAVRTSSHSKASLATQLIREVGRNSTGAQLVNFAKAKGVTISLRHAFRLMANARKTSRSAVSEDVQYIDSVRERFLSENPQGVFQVDFEGDTFRRYFLSFNSTDSRWQQSCPTLCADMALMRTSWGGALVVATSMSAAGRVELLAVALVQRENAESWVWFLTQLIEAVPSLSNGSPTLFMSDRHAGLEAAESLVTNRVNLHSVFCAVHVLKNCRRYLAKGAYGRFQKAYYDYCRAATLGALNEARRAMRNADPTGADYIAQIDRKKLCVYDSVVPREDLLTNNGCESANHKLAFVRRLGPASGALAVLEIVRRDKEKALIDQRDFLDAIAPSPVVAKISAASERAKACTVHRVVTTSTSWEHFDVSSSTDADKVYRVRWKCHAQGPVQFTCSCPQAQRSAIPCKHVLRVATLKRRDIRDLLEPRFLMSAFLRGQRSPDGSQPTTIDSGVYTRNKSRRMWAPVSTGRAGASAKFKRSSREKRKRSLKQAAKDDVLSGRFLKATTAGVEIGAASSQNFLTLLAGGHMSDTGVRIIQLVESPTQDLHVSDVVPLRLNAVFLDIQSVTEWFQSQGTVPFLGNTLRSCWLDSSIFIMYFSCRLRTWLESLPTVSHPLPAEQVLARVFHYLDRGILHLAEGDDVTADVCFAGARLVWLKHLAVSHPSIRLGVNHGAIAAGVQPILSHLQRVAGDVPPPFQCGRGQTFDCQVCHTTATFQVESERGVLSYYGPTPADSPLDCLRYTSLRRCTTCNARTVHTLTRHVASEAGLPPVLFLASNRGFDSPGVSTAHIEVAERKYKLCAALKFPGLRSVNDAVTADGHFTAEVYMEQPRATLLYDDLQNCVRATHSPDIKSSDVVLWLFEVDECDDTHASGVANVSVQRVVNGSTRSQVSPTRPANGRSQTDVQQGDRTSDMDDSSHVPMPTQTTVQQGDRTSDMDDSSHVPMPTQTTINQAVDQGTTRDEQPLVRRSKRLRQRSRQTVQQGVVGSGDQGGTTSDEQPTQGHSRWGMRLRSRSQRSTSRVRTASGGRTRKSPNRRKHQSGKPSRRSSKKQKQSHVPNGSTRVGASFVEATRKEISEMLATFTPAETRPGRSPDAGNDKFTVAGIFGRRKRHGQVWYLVKWSGFSVERGAFTWQSELVLSQDVPLLVAQFDELNTSSSSSPNPTLEVDVSNDCAGDPPVEFIPLKGHESERGIFDVTSFRIRDEQDQFLVRPAGGSPTWRVVNSDDAAHPSVLAFRSLNEMNIDVWGQMRPAATSDAEHDQSRFALLALAVAWLDVLDVRCTVSQLVHAFELWKDTFQAHINPFGYWEVDNIRDKLRALASVSQDVIIPKTESLRVDGLRILQRRSIVDRLLCGRRLVGFVLAILECLHVSCDVSRVCTIAHILRVLATLGYNITRQDVVDDVSVLRRVKYNRQHDEVFCQFGLASSRNMSARVAARVPPTSPQSPRPRRRVTLDDIANMCEPDDDDDDEAYFYNRRPGVELSVEDENKIKQLVPDRPGRDVQVWNQRRHLVRAATSRRTRELNLRDRQARQASLSLSAWLRNTKARDKE